MIFTETPVPGAWLIDIEQLADERGFFARTYCAREFEQRGLDPAVAQCNVSFNRRKGTLRGMHSHAPGFEEAKLVRCTSGAIFDVILDLRTDSQSYLTHYGAELTAENRRALFVPKGVYHGFLTLTDNSEVFYQMSEYYMPGNLIGVRYDDPAFGIEWPGDVAVISDTDRNFSDYEKDAR